jgi:hypothetical protein
MQHQQHLHCSGQHLPKCYLTSKQMIDNVEETAPEGLLVTISDLARLKGVHKSSISRRVDELEKQGQLEVSYGPNKTKLVNLAQYDSVAGETTDFVKEQAAETTRYNREAEWGDSRFREAQIRKAQYKADLKSIELRKQHGQLVDVTRVQAVIAEVGEELRKPLEQLPLRADELHAAALSGGPASVRAKLKAITHELRGSLVEALKKLDMRNNSGSSPA